VCKIQRFVLIVEARCVLCKVLTKSLYSIHTYTQGHSYPGRLKFGTVVPDVFSIIIAVFLLVKKSISVHIEREKSAR
jgi:hypothetical protein